MTQVLFAIKNTKTAYGSVAKGLHWASFIGVVGISAIGFIMADMPRGEGKSSLIKLHASLGHALLILLSVRFLWRVKNLKPVPVDSGATIRNCAATAVHYALYAVLFAIMGSGMFALFTVGWAVPFFGIYEIPSPLVRDIALHHIFEDIHGYAWWSMLALLGGHLFGVLYHAFILKDRTFARMWLGSHKN